MEKLKKGDEIRVIAPSTGIRIVSQSCRDIAKKRFEELGLKVTFGQNTIDDNWDAAGSTSVANRTKDLHAAFLDKNVKAVFSVIGGHNSNQLLDFIDYDIIKNNPKIFCGFSDITALLNAVYAKTGMVTFSGPHFSTLGMEKGVEYTINNLAKMLFGSEESDIVPSPEWSDDLWFIDQKNREFIKNDGHWILQNGSAEGTLIGGNLCTFNLLLGTMYRPRFIDNTILFIEDTGEASIADFSRNFQALLQQPDAKNIKGILIGRFQKKSNVDRAKLEFVLKQLDPYLNNRPNPIIANLDFGHTTPLLTIPIGGKARIESGRIFIKR